MVLEMPEIQLTGHFDFVYFDLNKDSNLFSPCDTVSYTITLPSCLAFISHDVILKKLFAQCAIPIACCRIKLMT